MIRYLFEESKVRRDIELEDPKWFSKAKRRTAGFIKNRRFEEKSSIWSDAKPAFMILQRNKCVFCERLFGGPPDSRIEMDLEHFRPKSSVVPWTRPDGQTAYPQDTGDASQGGYYWLAYNISNYAASCKTCNTIHKSNAFPIAGARCIAHDDAVSFSNERPYLCYPIGDVDADPESLISFTGTIAVPKAAAGFERQRALLTIDFFGLNTHDLLHFERAREIERFGSALMAVADDRAGPADTEYVKQIGNPRIGHANCVRSFSRLWQTDEPLARRILAACRELLAARLTAPDGSLFPGVGPGV